MKTNTELSKEKLQIYWHNPGLQKLQNFNEKQFGKHFDVYFSYKFRATSLTIDTDKHLKQNIFLHINKSLNLSMVTI